MTNYFLFIKTENLHSPPAWENVDIYQKEDSKNAFSVSTEQLTSPTDEERNIILVWPALHAIYDAIDLPSNSKPSHIDNAIKYHLEEYALDDIDSFTISSKQITADRWLAVGIPTQLVTQWLNFFNQHHIVITTTILDTHLLSPTPSVLTIISDPDNALLCLDTGKSYACDHGNLSLFIEDISSKAQEYLPVTHYHYDSTKLNDESDKLVEDITLLDIPINQWLVNQQTNTAYWNISPQQNNEFISEFYALIKKPKFALATTVTLLFLLIVNIISWQYYSHAGNEYKAQAISVYKEIYPQDKRIVSLKRQIKQHLNNQTNTSSSSLSKLLVSALTPTNNITVESLRFQQNNGVIIDINAPSHEAIQEYLQSIEEHQVSAKLLNANQLKSAINAKIQITI